MPQNSFDKDLLDSSLLRAQSLEELRSIEEKIVCVRQQQLQKRAVDWNFDYNHLKLLHRELFKDIYTWAGKDRYDMGYMGVFRKGETEFANAKMLPSISKGLFGALKEENLFMDLERDSFIKSAASFLNGLNILHPFREGNGRVQRLFMELLAENAGYDLNISTVPQSIIIQASILGTKGQNIGLEKIIEKGLTEKSESVPYVNNQRLFPKGP